MSDARLILEALKEHAATYTWSKSHPLVTQLINIIERKLRERELDKAIAAVAADQKGE